MAQDLFQVDEVGFMDISWFSVRRALVAKLPISAPKLHPPPNQTKPFHLFRSIVDRGIWAITWINRLRLLFTLQIQALMLPWIEEIPFWRMGSRPRLSLATPAAIEPGCVRQAADGVCGISISTYNFDRAGKMIQTSKTHKTSFMVQGFLYNLDRCPRFRRRCWSILTSVVRNGEISSPHYTTSLRLLKPVAT